MSRTSIRIGNAGGFWGDDPDAARRQVERGDCHYLTADYLAETTLAILQSQRASDPNLGYATDFVTTYVPLLPKILEKRIRIVVNAGGLAPLLCARRLQEEAARIGLVPKIAVVEGDGVPGLGLAAHAYLGAPPIAAALAEGAEIVITGRVADAALVLGPCLHEFGWTEADRLAQGIAAGHLIECGAQVSGGNSCEWREVGSFHEIGFPIVEVEESGDFTVTKPAGSGGRVTVGTVKEQLLYEVEDPSAYVSPDVVADFSAIKLTQSGSDCVRVTGAKGREATSSYKVSTFVEAGWKTSGTVFVAGPDAREKAKRYAEIFWRRCPSFEATLTELVGWNAFAGVPETAAPNDVELRLSARDPDIKKLYAFAKLLPAFLLAGPPGMTFSGSLPKAVPLLKLQSTFVEKSTLAVTVRRLWDDKVVSVPGALLGSGSPAGRGADQVADRVERAPEPTGARLADLAFARSGDKGDCVNIAVFARREADYPLLVDKLSAQAVKNWFGESCRGRVRRYPAPGLNALNFVLEEALDGGGLHSLRVDALGKGHAHSLLRLPLNRG